MEPQTPPALMALNKCDRLSPTPDMLPGALPISAADGTGVEALLQRIEDALNEGTHTYQLLIPFSSYSLLDKLHRSGGIYRQEHRADGCFGRNPRRRPICKKMHAKKELSC